MNAVEYFKSYGLSEAKRILRDARGCAGVRLYDKYNFSTDDLKQIVDAFELVGENGGLNNSRKEAEMLEWSNQSEWYNKLAKAINLVEQCS